MSVDYWPPDGDDDDCWHDDHVHQLRDVVTGPEYSDKRVNVEHDGVVRQTAKAVLYKFGKRVTMPQWMATKNGLMVTS